MIENTYWHSLKIPAKYNDNRFLTWDQFFLSYAILPRLPLSPNMWHAKYITPAIIPCPLQPFWSPQAFVK